MIKKKLVPSLILLIFLFNILTPSINIAQAADETVDLEISTKEELIAFANNVNSGNSYAGKTIVLTDDIDLEGNQSNQWTPIGNSSNYFEGNFDGRNHTISGIYINSSLEYQGLFGYTKGEISNLIVSDSSINLTKYKRPSGGTSYIHDIGIIAGYSMGDIQNCNVNNSTINININNNSDIVSLNIGMIAGSLNAPGIISKCTANGTITNALQKDNIYAITTLGGIVGNSNSTTIEKCTNNTKIINSNGQDINIGGIVGQSMNTIIYDSFNKGNISGTIWCEIGGITSDINGRKNYKLF